ncbi:MAG: 16S rRNA (adenine(1518)-N(6)/adenine(1519)-N(6))-dimethyltransferase RsmA [Bifidobacteriaceae bacterium]|jgi:16S rRNA (adenine1518-N6/adenine1519-N6)-dimethyltransferase|nr:16S rRNA (adenine(1518)-N(6)/adenine(1519)-N(6))-dimethyltransferase RsmA [Bifidobacteriaceae bacterium]
MSEPLSLATLKYQLEKLQVRPSKKRGQNFIYVQTTIDKIASLAEVNSIDHVLEIGPGLGALSRSLAERARLLTLVEIDSRLAAYLESVFENYQPPVSIINQDFLELKQIPASINKCVSNLPYNLAVPIILTLYERFAQIEESCFLVQREQAERLCAVPNTKLYGIPTLKLQYFASVKIVSQISRNVFYPRPHVDSTLIRVTRNSTSVLKKLPPYDQFAHLVDQSFKHRRKKIVNNLKPYYPEIETFLAEMGLSSDIRAENLTFSQFIELTSLVASI